MQLKRTECSLVPRPFPITPTKIGLGTRLERVFSIVYKEEVGYVMPHFGHVNIAASGITGRHTRRCTRTHVDYHNPHPRTPIEAN